LVSTIFVLVILTVVMVPPIYILLEIYALAAEIVEVESKPVDIVLNTPKLALSVPVVIRPVL
jgi:hypothetical protein